MAYTITTPRQLQPVTISASQARSVSRILTNNGRPCQITTMNNGENLQPIFLGVTAGEVAAAAHYIPSLAGLPWLKIILAEDKTDTAGHYFTSSLLRWDR